ncbi:MAG: CBS domain-containing protein [Cytophagaceae bacterium]
MKLSDTAGKALKWMEEFRVRQLAVIDNSSYKGIITEETLVNLSDPESLILDLKLDFQDVFVYSHTHFYDVIKLATKTGVELVAVLDESDCFLGVISVNETSSAVAKMFASQGPGGVIVLSMKENDYSLSQISRLVEANDTKILSSFVSVDESDPASIKLTLKLNRVDLSRVIATFERYEYKILAHFHETELNSSDKDRLDLLFRYLNI